MIDVVVSFGKHDSPGTYLYLVNRRRVFYSIAPSSRMALNGPSRTFLSGEADFSRDRVRSVHMVLLTYQVVFTVLFVVVRGHPRYTPGFMDGYGPCAGNNGYCCATVNHHTQRRKRCSYQVGCNYNTQLERGFASAGCRPLAASRMPIMVEHVCKSRR